MPFVQLMCVIYQKINISHCIKTSFVHSLFFLPTFVLLLFSHASFSELTLSNDKTFLFQPDVKIPVPVAIGSQDNYHLDARIFRPAPNEDASKVLYPTVILITSWASPSIEYEPIAWNLARRGYQVLVYVPRGFWGSGGKGAEVEVASPNDVNDTMHVIDWLIANHPTNPNAIAAGGISYGAGISLMAATKDERIRAIFPINGWGSLDESLAPGLTPRLDYIHPLNIGAYITGDPHPSIQQNIDDLLQLQNIPSILDWTSTRSPLTTWDATVNQRADKLAVYAISNTTDELFQANSIADLINLHKGPKRFDFNFGPHGIPDGIDQINPFSYSWNNIISWLDHYLMGKDNDFQCLDPINTVIRFKNNDTSFRESYAHFMGADADTRQIFYLHSSANNNRGTLQSSPNSGDEIELSFNTEQSLIENGWLIEQTLGHRQWDLTSLDLSHGLIFESAPLTSDVFLRGASKLSFYADAQFATQYFAYLIAYNPANGETRWMTHGSISEIPEDGSRPSTATVKEIQLDFIFTSVDIPAGYSIALVLDSQDVMFLSHTAQKPTTNTIYLGSNFPTKLTLPITPIRSEQKNLNNLPASAQGCDDDIPANIKPKLGVIAETKTASASSNNVSTLKSSSGGSIPFEVFLSGLIILFIRRKLFTSKRSY